MDAHEEMARRVADCLEEHLHEYGWEPYRYRPSARHPEGEHKGVEAAYHADYSTIGLIGVGGRKSAIWLYEPQGDDALKPVCHGDFEGRYEEDFAIFLSAMIDVAADPMRQLPPEEQQAYKDAQQSVIDARRSAERNEGQRWIG